MTTYTVRLILVVKGTVHHDNRSCTVLPTGRTYELQCVAASSQNRLLSQKAARFLLDHLLRPTFANIHSSCLPKQSTCLCLLPHVLKEPEPVSSQCNACSCDTSVTTATVWKKPVPFLGCSRAIHVCPSPSISATSCLCALCRTSCDCDAVSHGHNRAQLHRHSIPAKEGGAVDSASSVHWCVGVLPKLVKTQVLASSEVFHGEYGL